jgi:hypothetical protein
MIGRHATVAGILVAASIAAIGCGGSSPGSPTILNTEKVERAIEQSISAQRGQDARASCPSGVHQKKDLVFTCAATTAKGTTPFTVTQLDASGHVRYEAR